MIAFNRMQSILELDVEERTALVQPGHPNAAARPRGAAARLALHARPVLARGLGDRRQHRRRTQAACTASGTASRRDHVLGLEVVLGDGSIVWLEDTDAERPARARDRQRGHARDRDLRARAPAAAARAPGRRGGGIRAARAGGRVRRAHGAGGAGARGLRVHRRRDAARARPPRAGRAARERRGGAADRGGGARGGHRPRDRGRRAVRRGGRRQRARGAQRRGDRDRLARATLGLRRARPHALRFLHPRFRDAARPPRHVVARGRRHRQAPRPRALVRGASRRRQPPSAAALRRPRARLVRAGARRPARSCS